MSITDSYEVIIIGAGFAGLSAAASLIDRGIQSVLVLEARDRVGGRSYTITSKDGIKLDVGGAYVGPSQNRLWRMCERFQIGSKRVFEAGRSVTCLSGKRVVHNGQVPPLSVFTLLDINTAMNKTDDQASLLNKLEPWLRAAGLDVDKLDKQSMAEWIDQACDTQEARLMYRGVVRNLCCVEAHEVSALYWLAAVSSAGGTHRQLEIDNAAQERKLIGGTQQICVKLAAMIGSDRVKLNSPVSKIDRDETGVLVHCADGRLYQAQYAVFTLPHSLYDSVEWQPAMPSIKAENARRMYCGSIIKVLVRYDRPWWREAGYSGYFFDADSSIICGCYDDCQINGNGVNYYGLIGFVSADSARQWRTRSRDDRLKAICEQFGHVFNNIELASKPMEYVEHDWSSEKWNDGCYSCIAGPGVMTNMRGEFRKPMGRVWFAGTETAVHWAGYFDGAIESGERAAFEIMQSMGKIASGKQFQLDEPVKSSFECQPRPLDSKWVERKLPRAATAYWSIWGAIAAAATSLAFAFRSRL